MLADINLMVGYASRVGLIQDKSILAPVEDAMKCAPENEIPDASVLAPVMSSLVVLIAPITLADLLEGRDPFAPRNQKRSRWMQIVMTVGSLVMLANIVFSMHYLRSEKEALVRLAELDESRPAQRLTELRRIAQNELPAAHDDSARLLAEKYYAKRAEYLQLNRQVVSFTYDTQDVAGLPLVPVMPTLPSFGTHLAVAQTPEPQKETEMSGASNGGNAGGAAPDSTKGSETYSPELVMCSEKDGQVALPPESSAYPGWLKGVMLDAVTDYCFQVAVANAGSNSALQAEAPDSMTYGRKIRGNMSLRTVWILPLTLGFLGATIFMMQNVANVRTPAVEWHSLAMRIAMGGIAGVAAGWFVGGDMIKLPEASPISISFALAFLTGYSIDIFFQALARLSATVTQNLSKPSLKAGG